MKEFDTICAIATALGEGGIAIIRISGDKALDIASKIFKPKSNDDIRNMKSYTMKYGHIYDGETNELIDEVIISFMKGPKSFTAEDTIEINCHGGVVSTNKVLETVIKAGARLAEPGEFTKRAFLNGRIDLSQAEAVMDIITAKTDLAMKSALMQSNGYLSKEINRLREYMLNILALVEFAVDFTEDDEEIDPSIPLKVGESLEKAISEMNGLLKSADEGKLIREGLSLAIVGKPNVGKSSLLNSILGENRAIVTEIAGTTRDVIEEFVNIKGIPLKIVDTAGIRETEDIVEKIGVQKSKESIDSADLVIIVLDSSKPLTDEDLEILENARSKKTIVLLNKIDLEQAIDQTVIEEIVGKDNIIKISALKNEGIEKIHDKIEAMVFAGDVKSSSSVVITNSRHKDALFKAYNSINDAIAGIDQRLPYDFIEVDFKNIWDYLGYINGDTVQEDLLDTIFSNFCIGK